MIDSLAELVLRHAGQTVTVCGTGPSLDRLGALEGPRIYLNRAAFALPVSAGESYWLVADDAWAQGIPGPWRETLEAVRGGSGLLGVFRDPLLMPFGGTRTLSGPGVVHWRECRPRARAFAMSREEAGDAGLLYQFAGTASVAVYLAWLMGAAAVRLVGCDGSGGHAGRLAAFYGAASPAVHTAAASDARAVAAALGLEIEDWSNHADV